MENQVRYLVDSVKPNNINNLVKHEVHYLEDRRFKCLVPFQGSFYAESMRVFQQGTAYELKHNKDFVYSDIDVDISTQLGEAVANVVIITNSKLGRDFTVNYTAVGLPTPEVTKRTVALLEAPETGPVSDSYIDVKNKPKEFTSTFHYQTLSDIENFEYILFFLEKIRLAVVYETTQPIRQYLLSVETAMQVLLERSTGRFLTEVEIGFKNFREHFTKYNFGLDKIKNIGLLDNQASYSVATGADKSVRADGLLSMRALISFKAGIYDAYLGGDVSIIGKEFGTVIPPTLENYYRLVIGTTVLIDTYSNNINHGVTLNQMAYPNIHRTNSRFNIKKIVNDLESRCIVVATEIETQKVFIGNISKTNVGYLAEWREVVRPWAITTSVLDVGSHLADRNNPHKDSKKHIDLELMENIPVAGLLDIIKDSKERKYLRWDLLDKYMKRFLLKRKPSKTEQLEDEDENLMRNISVVFSQCGVPCTGTNQCSVIEPVFTTTTTTTSAPMTTTTTTEESVITTTTTTLPPTSTSTTKIPITTTTTSTTTTVPETTTTTHPSIINSNYYVLGYNETGYEIDKSYQTSPDAMPGLNSEYWSLPLIENSSATDINNPGMSSKSAIPGSTIGFKLHLLVRPNVLGDNIKPSFNPHDVTFSYYEGEGVHETSTNTPIFIFTISENIITVTATWEPTVLKPQRWQSTVINFGNGTSAKVVSDIWRANQWWVMLRLNGRKVTNI